MPIVKTDRELGDLAGVSASAVRTARSKGKLIKTSEGYDTLDPLNHKYIIGDSVKAFAQRGGVSDPTAVEDGSILELEEQKLKADIAIKKKQARKLDRDHAVAIKETIPVETMLHWIGAFRAGIETNLLTIPNKIAKGDIELRDRIEKMVSVAIQKTKDDAAKSLRAQSESILDAINGDD